MRRPTIKYPWFIIIQLGMTKLQCCYYRRSTSYSKCNIQRWYKECNSSCQN